MQFVNIVVHSVEDMNFRVHLQYEFTSLKLDDYLEKLRLCESEELQVTHFFVVKIPNNTFSSKLRLSIWKAGMDPTAPGTINLITSTLYPPERLGEAA